MVGKWHLGTHEFLPTNHGFDYYYGAPMTQNECTGDIKYPGSSFYRAGADGSKDQFATADPFVTASSTAPPPPLPPLGNCSTKYVVQGVGLSSDGQQHPGHVTVAECCVICDQDPSCGAWTHHSSGMGCITSREVLPHVSPGTKDAISGSKTPIPPKPWPAPPPRGGRGFGPCPILNGSDGAVTEQYALTGSAASTPPKLYHMLGIDENYDVATEGFIRRTVASKHPFFFYFCSHHTHAPQFAPEEFLGYSRRGLHGDSLGLIDRSAGRVMNLTKELAIDSETLMIFSAGDKHSKTCTEYSIVMVWTHIVSSDIVIFVYVSWFPFARMT